MNWYLIQTKPNGHSRSSEHLKRQGFEVFLPLIVKTSKKKGKFLDSTTPLFPGYLFIHTSIDPVPWTSINGTRGVSKAVTLDRIYRPVNTHIIEGLKYRCDERGVIQSIKDIEPGDRVKIEAGPFTDFICKVDKIEASRRAWVFINLLKRQIRAEISLDYLQKIN